MRAAPVLLLLVSACGGGLPRNVRESFHRDHPECGSRDMSGTDLGAGRWSVQGCGSSGVYVCRTGEHSRWHLCELESAAPQ